MTLTIGDIDAWDTGALEEFSHHLDRRTRTLTDLGDEVSDAARLPEWAGVGADAAQLGFERLSTDVSDRVATVGAIKELISSLIEQVRALKVALDEAQDHAAAFGLTITDAGAVVDGPGAGPAELAAITLGGPVGVGAGRAAKEAARAEIQTRVQVILAIAADVEADTTSILTTAAHGGFTAGGLSVDDAEAKGRSQADDMFAAPPPPEDVTAQQYYLDALSQDQREEIIRERPEWLANAFGIDPAVRSQAAEAYIPKLRGEILAERAPLVRELQELRGTTPVGPGGPAVLASKIREIETKLEPLDNALADLEKINETVSADSTVHLLGLHRHEGGVGAVVAQGDITAADHVTVNVPGTGTNARDGLQGQLDTLTELERKMVEQLIAEDREPETIATVTYLNTELPPTLPEARHTHYADTAAPELAAVLNGINATSTGGANLTLLGHSYGSLVASEALQAGGRADSVVFYGSPGLETSGDDFDADSLGVAPERRYVMHAAREPIQVAHLADPFGGLPQHDPGLIRLGTSAHDDRGLAASTGHSEYHLPDSTSLHNFAAVAVGSPDAVVAYDPEKFNDDNYRRLLGVNVVPKWPF